MNQKSDAKEKILKTAARLFQRQGYHATGLSQIIAESGAPKGSLYYYFPNGKEELAVAAIEYTRDTNAQRLRTALARFDDPIRAFQSIMQDAAVDMHDVKDIVSCTISLLALENALCSEPLRLACKSTYDAFRKVFIDKLGQCGFDPEQAYRLGGTVQMLIDGAFIRSLAEKNTQALLDVADMIPQLLKRD